MGLGLDQALQEIHGSDFFLLQVVSVTVRLVPFVRAVWLLCQGSVALVTVTVVRWGLVPVAALRW